MNHFTLPELEQWGTDSSSQFLVGVHGFAGGAQDYGRLAKHLTETNSGLQVVSYDRKRNPNLKPPRIEGTGAIQANAAELLIVLGELSQNNQINSLSVAGHSLGGPIIAAAISMVYNDNLPPSLSNEQLRLAQILDHALLYLIAPAGFTDAYALMPTSGFAAHSLAKAIFNGAKGIMHDAEGLKELWAQRQRALSAARYLSRFRFSVEECIDACGPHAMQTFANFDPKKLTLVAYQGDEIFSEYKIRTSLENPNIRDHDFAIYQALTQLNPTEIAKLVAAGNRPEDVIALFGLRAMVAYRATETRPWEPTKEEAGNLLKISRNIIRLKGNHTTLLTAAGANELANAYNSRQTEK